MNKPMQGLADFLRASAYHAPIMSDASAETLRQWAADVDAATPASAAEAVPNLKLPEGAKIRSDELVRRVTFVFPDEQRRVVLDALKGWSTPVVGPSNPDGSWQRMVAEKAFSAPKEVGISASEAADPMNYKGMFEAAVSSLAEISAALGIEEEDAACANGNELILEAIARKNEAIMAAITRPATPPASEPHLQLHGMAGYYVLRGAIEALRVTGRFIDEEGESTDALEDFADAAREAAHATPSPAPQPAGVVEALRDREVTIESAMNMARAFAGRYKNGYWQADGERKFSDAKGEFESRLDRLLASRAALASLPEQPIPAKPLTRQVLINMRSSAKSDPGCADEYWFIIFARAIEQAHGISAAPTQDTQGGGK